MNGRGWRLGLFSAVALSGWAQAAEESFSVGNKAAPLTQQGGTARAMSMGSAFVGIAEGSETLLWNPAGLGTLCGKEVGLHHTSGIGDSIREIGIFSSSLGSWGGFAGSLNGASNGSFEGRDASGNQTGNYHAGNLGATLGWGKSIAPRLAVGSALKTNHQSLADSTYYSYAADLGVLWNPFSSVKVGATYSNLNIANSYGPYALNSGWRLGTSYRPIKPLLVAMATELQPGGVDRVQLGGEYTYDALLSIRGGYQFNYPNADLSGTTGFTLGAGLHLLQQLNLDYAFVPEGELGSAHRISVVYKFGCAEKSVSMQKSEATVTADPLPPAEGTVIAFQDAHFDFDKSILTEKAKTILDANILVLRENPHAIIRISGYTSAQGSAAYNQTLSEQRAGAVRDYLLANGIAPERLTVIGFGNERPAEIEADPSDIHSKAARANMRTLFEIVVK